MDAPDGMINVDSKVGRVLGFTSDKFAGWLWKKDGAIYISFIASKEEGKGHFRQLLDTLEATGLDIKVPTPSNRMCLILGKRDYKLEYEYSPVFGENCEILTRRYRLVAEEGDGK